MRFCSLPMPHSLAAVSPRGGATRGRSMSEIKSDECLDHGFSDRASLITYLQYVVDEVGAIDEPSAILLRMVISNLAHSDSQLPGSNYMHRLC